MAGVLTKMLTNLHLSSNSSGVGFIAHPPSWVRLKDGVLGQRGDVQTSWALKRLRGAGIASPRSEICLSSVGNSGLQQTLNSRTGTGATICTPLYLVHTWLFYGTWVHFTIIQGKQCKAWVYFCYRAQGCNQLLRLVFVLLRLPTFPSVLNFLVSSFQWRKKECLCLTSDDLHGNYHVISISNCRFLQALQRCVQVSVQM